VEWLDPHSGLTRRYQFLYWPSTREVEMYDLKNRRAFLKKTAIPTLLSRDLFLGAVVAVYSRQLRVVEFGDQFTEETFSVSRQRSFCVIPRAFTQTSLGKIVNALQKSGFAIADVKMCESGTGVALVAENAVQKALSLRVELERHFGEGCAACASSSAEAAAMEAEFVSSPAIANADGSSTLCLVKPSAMEHLGLVLDGITNGDATRGGFAVTGLKSFALDRVSASEFFEVYRGVVPEFSMMVDEITSGAFAAVEVSSAGDASHGNSVVEAFRELVGPVDPEMARALRPHSLRAKFGFDTVRNAVHCTDLAEDGALETQYFFKILQEA